MARRAETQQPPERWRFVRRAQGYVEVVLGVDVAVVADIDSAVTRLVAAVERPGTAFVSQLANVINRARRGHELASCEAAVTGLCGSVSLHNLSGHYVVTWYHQCGWLGAEILGKISSPAARRRLRELAGEFSPNRSVNPPNMMGLSNVRPWTRLPEAAEACFNVVAEVNGDVVGDVMIHRWLGNGRSRWLVTMFGDEWVFGKYVDLLPVAKRLEKRYHWGGLEVTELIKGVKWPLHLDLPVPADPVAADCAAHVVQSTSSLASELVNEPPSAERCAKEASTDSSDESPLRLSHEPMQMVQPPDVGPSEAPSQSDIDEVLASLRSVRSSSDLLIVLEDVHSDVLTAAIRQLRPDEDGLLGEITGALDWLSGR